MSDAVVVGAGPNGLAAAVELARSGVSVTVYEAEDTLGGGARTAELTLPGFLHDVGSAVHPMGVASPFLSTLPLGEHGLEWVEPPRPLAHVLDGGRAVFLHRDLDETADALGADAGAYRRLVGPFAEAPHDFFRHVLHTPFRPPGRPVLMGRFALRALRSTTSASRRFQSDEARALLAGNAAHAGIPLTEAPSAAVGLTLMVAGHAVGWPLPRGGAGRITEALASYLRSLGGRIETGRRVRDLGELPPARATLLDLTPRQIARLSGLDLPARARRRMERWTYGPGAFKVDWALDGAIPWEAEGVDRAGTVHVGGTLEEVARAEAAPWRGEVAPRPFVLLAQPSLFDPSRAPEGKHTAWAYAHVPNGWTGDALEAIETQVERFAPGFRERILARAVHDPAALESGNANLGGGAVDGGAPTLSQLFGPARWRRPWSTPIDGLYVCSSSTPPGGGVHGMCGYHAARAALRNTFGAG